MTWSTQCLDSQPVNSRVREISRSLTTCPPRWMAINLSPLRCLASSHLTTLNTQYLGLYPTNPRVLRSLPRVLPRWTVLIFSLLRRLASSCLTTLNTQYLGLYPVNPRVHEISPISATHPSHMDGPDLLATSPPRVLALHDFEHPILGPLSCEPPSSRDLSDLCHASFPDGWS
jgi:hypothetical protein